MACAVLLTNVVDFYDDDVDDDRGVGDQGRSCLIRQSSYNSIGHLISSEEGL